MGLVGIVGTSVWASSGRLVSLSLLPLTPFNADTMRGRGESFCLYHLSYTLHDLTGASHCAVKPQSTCRNRQKKVKCFRIKIILSRHEAGRAACISLIRRFRHFHIFHNIISPRNTSEATIVMISFIYPYLGYILGRL